MEFAATVAAAEAGIPTARVASTNSQGEARVVTLATAPLDTIRQEARLDPDNGAALRAEPAFTSFPPSLDGNTLAAGARAPFRVRLARGRALADPEMRAAAGRIAREISLMPSMNDAVRELERLNPR